MNAPETFYRATFTAWMVSDGSTTGAKSALFARSLPAAEDEIAAAYSNKETILVLEADGISGTQTLHTYRVRVGKPQWRQGFDKPVARKTAERICSVRVNAFEPVEPWRWTPGCDVVGRGESILSGEIA